MSCSNELPYLNKVALKLKTVMGIANLLDALMEKLELLWLWLCSSMAFIQLFNRFCLMLTCCRRWERKRTYNKNKEYLFTLKEP